MALPYDPTAVALALHANVPYKVAYEFMQKKRGN